MRGEDLQGLNIEELQQLEKSLETGLSRVIEKKVCVYCISTKFGTFMGWAPIGFLSNRIFCAFQGERIMKEINDLQKNVRNQTSRYDLVNIERKETGGGWGLVVGL